MRLSELLRGTVVDEAGAEVGRVRDVRLVRDGTGSYRVAGLLVGPVATGVRLGYGRTAMKGPWLLAAPFHARHRSLRFVPWGRVIELDGEHIKMSGSAADLAEPEPLPR